jgi:hypothetical protein
MRRCPLVLALAALAVASLPGRAAAHDLRATVRLLPEAVEVEAGFDDDTPAEGAKVVITDASGNEVAAGRTDERGLLRLSRPGRGKYVAVAESAGHRDEVPFEVVESDDFYEFANWRLDRRVGLAAGVGGLLALSLAFWWFRLRKPAA